VAALLNDEDALVRGAAVHWLELADLQTRVEQGWPLLDDPARTVRLEAARVLAPLSGQHLPERLRSQLDVAVAEYTSAQDVNADRPEAHFNLGLLAATTGKPLEAERDYRQALRLDRRFTPAYVNLADLYRQLERDADCEAVLREGIAAVPDDASLYHALGLVQVRRQQLSAAVASLQHAVELQPETTRYRYVWALALQQDGRLPEAAGELEAVLKADPMNHEARLALIGIYREQGNANMAQLHLLQLRSQFPDDSSLDTLWQELNP